MTEAERTALEYLVWDLSIFVPKMRCLADSMEELGHSGWAADLNNQARFWEWVTESLAHDLVPA